MDVALDSPLQGLIARLSPGTADLLDYRDTVTVAESSNPFLANLNRSPCSASTQALSLVAGTDGIRIPLAGVLLSAWIEAAIAVGVLDESDRVSAEAIDRALRVGNFVTGSSSDGVVPGWSAQGQDASGFDAPALGAVGDGGLLAETANFNHLDVGKEGLQALSVVMGDLILPVLSDWITVTEVPPEDPNVPALRLGSTPVSGWDQEGVTRILFPKPHSYTYC